MKLDLYNQKRNFKKTSEPTGKISHKNKNLYVIQKHAASHLHYDFRLELNGVLLSWAVPKGPSLDTSVKRLAMHVENHPVEYGHFVGIIPKGQYGGGTVMVWDIGTWISKDENPYTAYKKGHMRFELKGKKLKGQWSLIQFNRAKDNKSWFLIKTNDKYATPIKDIDITLAKPNSIISKYSIDEIAENYSHIWQSKKGLTRVDSTPKNASAIKNKKISTLKINLPSKIMPTVLYPQLATLVDQAPEGIEWIHEIKWDGYRILAYLNNKSIRLMSRNNKEWTTSFANIAALIKKKFKKNIILDGEVVLLDEQLRSNFQMLQNAMEANAEKAFIYYIFDILYYDQYDLTSLPLKERKNILKKLLVAINEPLLQYSDHIEGTGKDVFKMACKMSLEGIISKNVNSPYLQKRTKNWLKIKCSQRQEFIIGGYSPPKGNRRFFGSLFLGYHDKKGALIYCGNVGTGFTQDSLEVIYQKLRKNICKENPFTTRPPGVTSAIWVKPILICEVEFSEWTRDGSLRHPSFKGLRTDKKSKDIIQDKKKSIKNIILDRKISAVSAEIGITNPDKILYPEDKITKLDILTFYEKIQDWILPYIINRPLTLVRCPDNYNTCFYQKHINKTTPKTLSGLRIKEKDKTAECIYIKDFSGLKALVQMGSLEIHPWGSRIDSIEYPDTITFDLDPSPEISWSKLVAAAAQIRDYLKKYQLKSFVKTTGGKGLHIVIPIKPEYNWNIVKDFTHAFVNFLVEQHPKVYVGEMSKIKRKGKIFVDYLRNQRGATSVSAYSTRARRSAPVSVPIGWDELTNNRKDTYFTIQTLPARLKKIKKDPWKDFFRIKQSLKPLISTAKK
jgi:bifunctional non-homologous end joining protein LigD